MKQFILLCLVALAYGQQATEDNQVVAEQARQDDPQIEAIATDNQATDELMAIVAPIQKNDNAQQAVIAEQPISAQQPNLFTQAPQFVFPYPLFRNAFPAQPGYPVQTGYPIQPAFLQREIPAPIVHYVPVVLQPVDSELFAAQSRQISANFGAHLGGLGGGFSAGLSPAGFGAGAALGYGGPYTYYGQTVQSYPAYPTGSYYYSRAIPEPINQPTQQIKPQAITQPIVHAFPQF